MNGPCHERTRHEICSTRCCVLAGYACGDHRWPVDAEAALLAAPSGVVDGRAGEWKEGTGAAFTLALAPSDEIAFARAPERAPPPSTFAGVVRLPSLKPGLYSLSLSDRAWIDAIEAGRALAAEAFSSAQDCAVRKSVRFRFGGGAAVIQISGAEVRSLTMAVTPAE